MTLVHGDGYCSAGDESALSWLEGVLVNKYKLKTQTVGHILGTPREGQIQNTVCSTSSGFELEADPRHAAFFFEQLKLTIAKGVVTPGTDDQDR